jgi:hypothetical protein
MSNYLLKANLKKSLRKDNIAENKSRHNTNISIVSPHSIKTAQPPEEGTAH